MRSSAVAALQILQLFSQAANAAILPPGPLEPRQDPEHQQRFHETTVRLKEQGLCRLYDDHIRKGHHGLETCEPKCGDLVEKFQDDESSEFLRCVAKASDAPKMMDPEGQSYTFGDCECKAPVSDQSVDDISMTLPVVDDIGCSIVYEAFDKVLADGPKAIPEAQASMNVGLKAASQAAKTVDVNGKDSGTFLEWLDIACVKSNYTNVIQQIYDPLTNLPDSLIPSLGCKSRLCARRKASTKPSGNTASAPKPKPKPKDKGQKEASPPVSGKNTQSPGVDTKTPSTAIAKTKTSKNSVSPVTEKGNPTTKPTKPTKASAQITSSKTQAPTTSIDSSRSGLSQTELSATAAPGSTSVDFDTSAKQDLVSSNSDPPLLTAEKDQDTTLLTSTQTKEDSVQTATETFESTVDASVGSNDLALPTDAGQPAAAGGSSQDSSTSMVTPDTAAEPSLETSESPDPALLESPATSTEVSDVDVGGFEEIDGVPDPTLPEAPRASIEATSDQSPTSLEALTASEVTTAELPDVSLTDTCPIAPVSGSEELTTRTLNTFRMQRWKGLTYTAIDVVDASNINELCLNYYAKKAYQQLKEVIDPSFLVSALLVPRVGVVIGTKPRELYSTGGSTIDPNEATSKLKQLSQAVKSYGMYTKDRTGSIDSFHSEDVVILLGAVSYAQALPMGIRDFDRFPLGTRIATYGKYGQNDAEGWKHPCGYWTPDTARVSPSCSEVLMAFQVRTIAAPPSNTVAPSS
ncbi:MAG: hypothetical protein LQ337_008609 [Flavoplaca oasis]|nr:MAG: hypothetical protein LQ337_008609 [Flavoplaca oasis]